MQNEKRAEKILVLGIDGMDPAFTRVMVDEGKMNNVKTLLERGAARNDLVMLGGVPTITPPMWTTLATGATPSTHGITCFWNQHPEKLDTLVYALDSRICKAEPVWNVLAEAGKKTLVWHWPGASWPPTSDSANLNVVEGTQPAAIHAGCGIIDEDLMVTAAENYTDVRKIVAKALTSPSKRPFQSFFFSTKNRKTGANRSICGFIIMLTPYIAPAAAFQPTFSLTKNSMAISRRSTQKLSACPQIVLLMSTAGQNK